MNGDLYLYILFLSTLKIYIYWEVIILFFLQRFHPSIRSSRVGNYFRLQPLYEMCITPRNCGPTTRNGVAPDWGRLAPPAPTHSRRIVFDRLII